MEQQKLTNVKDTLDYLAKRFPQCFVLNGEVKPLKIGIFQDLATELEGAEFVSKRLLRMSLRHYTSGWKYLASMKEGAARVDLSGEAGELIEAEHATHASEQLAQSKKLAAEKREQQKAANKPKSGAKAKANSGSKYPDAKNRRPSKGGDARKVKQAVKPRMKVAPIDENGLKVGLKVSVKVGQQPMPATVTDIGKDGVFVQLNSGMTVKVQQQQLRVIVQD
ncbi:RNA chaperone ProQ [Ningiella sp. W23]|uniref:RNA chaperone ProQ n=1 Tax=Ningiella sp. W23 TaxID=3023715 RepID=UPI003757D077